jgi:hypothetical protein
LVEHGSEPRAWPHLSAISHGPTSKQ